MDEYIFPLLETLLGVAAERNEVRFQVDKEKRYLQGPAELPDTGGDCTVEVSEEMYGEFVERGVLQVQLVESIFLTVTLLSRLHSDTLIREQKKTFA